MTDIFRLLNNSNRCFIIAEAGSNWKTSTYKKSISRAKKLIDIAADAGADAIKFQTYNANSVYVKNAGKSNYLKKSGFDKDIYKIFEKFSMPYSILPILSKHCKKRKIFLMSTPFCL